MSGSVIYFAFAISSFATQSPTVSPGVYLLFWSHESLARCRTEIGDARVIERHHRVLIKVEKESYN